MGVLLISLERKQKQSFGDSREQSVGKTDPIGGPVRPGNPRGRTDVPALAVPTCDTPAALLMLMLKSLVLLPPHVHAPHPPTLQRRGGRTGGEEHRSDPHWPDTFNQVAAEAGLTLWGVLASQLQAAAV